MFCCYYKLDSLPKNENSVIYYSLSCRYKPVRTQIKIFLIKSEGPETYLEHC